MFTAYIDDSKTEHALVLAGFVARPEGWEKFSDRWAAMLRSTPRISHFKATHAARFEGEFRGISEAERDRKFSGLCAVVDEYAECGVSAVIELAPFKSVMAELNVPRKGTNPYYYAFSLLVRAITFNLPNISGDEPLDFVFDNQVMEKSRILNGWQQFIAHMPERDRNRVLSYPSFKDDALVYPLQAADLAARITQQWASDKLGKPVRGLLPPYRWSPKNGLFVRAGEFEIRQDFTAYMAAR